MTYSHEFKGLAKSFCNHVPSGENKKRFGVLK